jgi:hypothetical protein
MYSLTKHYVLLLEFRDICIYLLLIPLIQIAQYE